MVMSIEEEILSLEEQLKNTKGPGSVVKKEEIQAKINGLKEGIGQGPEKQSSDDPDPPPKEPKPDPLTPSVSTRNAKEGHHWVKATDDDAEEYAKRKVLAAHDPSLMRCLIKD